MSNQTFIANLKKAIRDRETANVGGGGFSGDDLREVLRALEAESGLRVMLTRLAAGLREHAADGALPKHFCALDLYQVDEALSK
jgi:hypothetical protein